MNTASKTMSTETLLGEMYKMTKMGADSITDILSRTKTGAFRDELTRQLDGYEKYAKQMADALYDKGEEPKEENIMKKMGAKIGTAMNTMSDSSESHLAQMVIEGDTMGITEMTRLVRENENGNCSEESLALSREVIRFLEDSVERTKKFL